MATVLTAELLGRDRTASKAMKQVADAADHTGRRLRQLGRDSGRAGSQLAGLKAAGAAMAAVASRATALLKPLAAAAVTVGSVGSAGLTVAPALIKAAASVGTVAKAAVQASPALLGMAAAGAFVALTLRRIAPAVGEALKPIASGFDRATEAAGRLASRGLTPLASGFTKLNMPAVSSGMNRIAVATNAAVRHLLQWANSAPGMAAIRSIVDASAAAFERVAPAASRAAVSLVAMLGRIAGVSAAAGSAGLVGVLDALAAKMDAVSADTVRAGFDQLAAVFGRIRAAVDWASSAVRTAVDFWRQHTAAINIARDALAVLAIAFGGPVAAAAGAVVLIIRHWDRLVAVWQSVVAYFSSPAGSGFLTNLQTAVETVWPPIQAAFIRIRDAILPVLQEIWAKIATQLIPALGQFSAAMAPVVAFMVEVLAPVVAAVWRTILQIISSALDIVIGWIKIFTGILTGDWSKVWEGVRQVVSGALGAVVAIVRGQLAVIQAIAGAALRGIAAWFAHGWAMITSGVRDAWSRITGAVVAGASAMLGVVASIPGRAVSALGNMGGLLVGAGRALIAGLLRGIQAEAERMYSYVASIAGKIQALKGPLPKDLRLLQPAGEAIMAGLGMGIQRGVRPVLADVGGIADQLAFAVTGSAVTGGPITTTPAAPTVVTLRAAAGADQAVATMIMELIRKSKIQLSTT